MKEKWVREYIADADFEESMELARLVLKRLGQIVANETKLDKTPSTPPKTTMQKVKETLERGLPGPH